MWGDPGGGGCGEDVQEGVCLENLKEICWFLFTKRERFSKKMGILDEFRLRFF